MNDNQTKPPTNEVRIMRPAEPPQNCGLAFIHFGKLASRIVANFPNRDWSKT